MEDKVIMGGFGDERNRELHDKIEDVIYDYAPKACMTYAAVIGVLQMLIMDLHADSKED